MRWLLFLLVCVTSANADVTRKQTVSSQFMGANEGTTTEYYSGDRHATESTLRWTRGLMKTMSGGKPVESGTIVRLDKELIWTLNPKDKTYTEMTFAQFRDMMKKGAGEMEQAKEEPADTAREEMYEWTIRKVESNEPKIIHGWNCRNMFVEATGVNKKDSVDKVIITINAWNCPDVPGAKEILDFNERYMKALGLDETVLTPGLMQASMLFQKELKAVIETGKNVPGEPVQSLMEIKHNQLKGRSLGKEVSETAKNQLLAKLPFGKIKEPKVEKPEYELKVKFSLSSALNEASTNAVDAAKFEIPAGHKLKK